MNRIASLITAVVLSGATMLFAIPAVAQVGETSVGSQAGLAKDDTTPPLTLGEVESALASIEADSGIEDSAKDLLRTKYAQAIEALREAASQAAKAAEYRASMTQAPDTTADLRAQLEELPSVESAGAVTALADPSPSPQSPSLLRSRPERTRLPQVLGRVSHRRWSQPCDHHRVSLRVARAADSRRTSPRRQTRSPRRVELFGSL